MGIIIGHTWFTGWLQGINEILHVKYLAERSMLVYQYLCISCVIVNLLKYNLFDTFVLGTDRCRKRKIRYSRKEVSPEVTALLTSQNSLELTMTWLHMSSQ